MTKTGPQQYPGASQAHRYDGKYPGDAMESNVIGWHSTEGISLPTYSGGSVAPNFTVVPNIAAKTATWYQHFDFDVSARAAVNLAGGVETNTANLCQIEIVGTCDPKHKSTWSLSGKTYVAGTHYLYMSALPTWFLDELAKFAAWANKNHGVKLQSIRPNGTKLKWSAYPGSYGASNGVRLSNTEWGAFYGHCGHQHLPENLHGDPGDMNIDYVLTKAKSMVSAPAAPTTPAKPKYEPFPGAAFFKVGRKSPIVAAMHARLVAVGCNHYQSTANKDVWGTGDDASYAAWQRHLGYSGSDADGTPGKTSWDKLQVPNV